MIYDSAAELIGSTPMVSLRRLAPGSNIIAKLELFDPGGTAGSHGLQGIGANFIPSVLDQTVIDRVITVTEDQAYNAARRFGKTEGLPVGISSGAALYAAGLLAEAEPAATIVVLLPDTGEGYLSTPLFE